METQEQKILEAKQKIKKVLSADRNTSRQHAKEIIFPVLENSAKELSDATGLKITTEYKHIVDKSGINHAFNHHGNDTEKLRGQMRLTDEDILKIPEIIIYYDDVRRPLNQKGDPAKTYNGNDLIQYEKTFHDGTTYYVEEVRTGKKELVFSSMWKRKRKD
ncbi:MAG: hypothetical protein FWE63_00555 [Bacteroidales bacterium]|nr:hypothetical protein [Bacteroidales bacterium]